MRSSALLVCVLLAGCAVPSEAPGDGTPVDPFRLEVAGRVIHHGGVEAGWSLFHLAEGDPTTITFPAGVLIIDGAGRLVPPGGPVPIARGEALEYLAPYGATRLRVDIGGEARDLPLSARDPAVDGARVVELMKFQRDNFPNRTPGQPSYQPAVEYFVTFFTALGYDVERFDAPAATPTLPVPLPVPGSESLTSVVATKRGVETPERYIVIGGHFDVVPGTTEGALDNTGGTMSVLALAETFARFETGRSIIFAAWGGEEDGILGSQAWLTAHPELAPNIDLYINYDVSGIAWPAPLVDPAPILAATGPDGPAEQVLAQQHATVVRDWMQLDVPFVYEGIAQGQATGAGVNAQSDHTPFMSRGIPVVFQFTSRIDDALSVIHDERDTVDNLARYSLLGLEGIETVLDASETARAEAALAASYEAQMVAGFYLMVLTDAGTLAPARPASLQAPVNARS